MANILLVEDTPDLGLFEAMLLEASGHRLFRCSGGPTPFAACPLMRIGSCPVADAADLILFSCGMVRPLPHRSYRGEHLLRAYRSHPGYGSLPMVLIAAKEPAGLDGTGRIETIEKFSHPRRILDAVERLLGVAPASSRRPDDEKGYPMKAPLSMASPITDEDARQRIQRSLERRGFTEPGYKVAIVIRNGIAHLSGNVRYEHEIAVVGALVAEFGGVTEVINRILYRERPPERVTASNGKEDRR